MTIIITYLTYYQLGQIEGAILLDWDEGGSVLDDTGGGDPTEDKVNQVVMDAARKELAEFHSKVLPVCDMLDNMGVLYVVGY